ncbi:17605_t:CDS:2 [Gigaspora margarita]|uniref:17605_t:CDS:1 n=1 Tax=Gigaspora margarita TaxID=4874 RepID=A0ABN7UDK2_GIGMA|nr:17605_t:CDS:2 [Gigaspora margarita]
MSEASNIDEIPTLEEIDKLDLSFKKLFDTSLKVEEINDIRVGYAYAHLKTQPLNIITHTEWQEYDGMPKVPTVLKYNESFEVVDWGYPALINLDRKNLNQKSNMKPVELFKLYLSNNDEMENMPYLPSGIDYKQAIVDYLRNIGDSLKEELKQWDNIDYFKNVRLVLTVPVEFDNDAISTMRDCAYKAGLTKQKHNSYGSNLLFVHEPEAAAVHCLKTSGECDLSVGDTFMVVDSGGGTVDITTMKWLKSGKLSEIIESKGDYCGGNYVDQEFLKFLAKKVGESTIKNLKEHHYGQIQYVIHKYVKDTIRDELESSMWVITIKYDDVKKMFDPIIDKIITLIHGRLEALDSNCSAMLLVGGFSESKYLRSRIRNEFKKIVPNISSPSLPMLAIVKGAVQFGASQKIIVDRILKWTYGTDVIRKWKPSDPLDRKIDDDHIIVFSRLAKKGEKVAVGEKVVRIFSTTHVVQHFMGLDLYVTHDEDAEYCDSPGVELLDNFTIKVPITGEKKREIIYIMNFGMVEIQVTAINPNNRVKYERVFNLDI